ncbi:hypothetical protein OIO90_005507 [Microbotryomycetes sp. JL221]|nr:hypothetical protein OIO90_005507 [Microbotryomycetes sp. JL221]
MASQYAQDGTPLRKDGEPDQRFNSNHGGFGQDRELAKQAGHKGGKSGSSGRVEGGEEGGPAGVEGDYNDDGGDPEAQVESEADQAA